MIRQAWQVLSRWIEKAIRTMSKPWRSLATVAFAERMRPVVDQLYTEIFPGSLYVPIEPLDSDTPHPLDKSEGIDGHLYLDPERTTSVSVQEKIRSHDALQYADFTVEAANGDGSPPEWDTLNAQLYLYCWASWDEKRIDEWVVFDVLRLRMIVATYGGPAGIADSQIHRNSRHGRATFYSIPLHRLVDAVVDSSFPLLKPRASRALVA